MRGFNHSITTLSTNAQNPEGTWCNANALWVDKSYSLDSTYLAQAKNIFGSDVQFADFRSNSKSATDTVNQWVQNQTKDRIKELFPALASDTRLVLANAVYFKNNWETAFRQSATRDDKFILLDRQTVTVPMMNMEVDQSFAYFQGTNFQMIELPYKGKHISMVILMPDEGQFDAVETTLTGDQFQKATQALTSRRIKLSMPRFKVEYELSLKPALQVMGVTDVFDPNLANLARLKSRSADPLYVAQALHKAYVNTDEQGTEAAAASGLVARPISVVGVGNYEVKIDHPFLFAIRDQETGTILFIGRVLNPLS